MNIFKNLVSIIFILILILSCDFHLYDPDKPKPGHLDKMPQETSIGANTFGCYINGELAASQGYYQEEGVEFVYFKNFVNGFWKEDENNRTMYLEATTKIAILNFRLEKDIHLGENECDFFALYLRKFDEMRILEGVTIDILKIDSVKHIISGRFDDITLHMTPSDIDTSIVFSISNGQFDIKYGQNF